MTIDSQDFQAMLHTAQNLGLGGGAAALLKTLFGDATNEVKAMVATRFRMNHFAKQIQMFGEAQHMLKAAGINPKSVNLKVLVPMLEGASLEEDEGLSKKWAAMLANAIAYQDDAIQPGFVDVLKQLTPRQAFMLDELFRLAPGRLAPDHPGTLGGFTPTSYGFDTYMRAIHAYGSITGQMDNSIYNTTLLHLENLMRLRLVIGPESLSHTDADFYLRQSNAGGRIPLNSVALSQFGHAFVVACQPPTGAK